MKIEAAGENLVEEEEQIPVNTPIIQAPINSTKLTSVTPEVSHTASSVVVQGSESYFNFLKFSNFFCHGSLPMYICRIEGLLVKPLINDEEDDAGTRVFVFVCSPCLGQL